MTELVFRRGLHLAATLLILILLAVAPWLALSAQADGPTPEASFVPGEILVKFKTNLTSAEVGKVKKELGLKTVEQIAGLGVQRVEVRPGDEQKTIEKLQGNPAVEYAEPNYILYAMPTTPNDPGFSLQWGPTKIQAPAAWDVVTGTVPITIAIVDTGVAQSHEDLSSKIVAGYNYWGGSPEDDNGHGTHVAGIATAATNNGKGVAGLSWGALIMPVKALDSSGNGSVSSVAAGIMYAADHNAQVINMSLGGTGLASDLTLKGAVDYAYGRGCLLAAAAGNCYYVYGYGYVCNDPLYPAAYDHVMAVAATDQNDNRAWFSVYGSYVDIAAPGVSIYSALPYDGYGYKDGTSMATPFASGLAALVWSVDRTLSNDQVENIIESTAVDLGSPGRDDYFGWGRINALAAVQRAAFPALALSTNATFFLADDSEVLPVPQQIGVFNNGGKALTWTATISPAASWLNIVPPDSGLATMSTPGTLFLTATRPATYGDYTATVVITSDSPNVQNSPQKLDVSMHYLPELYRYHLLLIFKQYSP
jgi:thermitase